MMSGILCVMSIKSGYHFQEGKKMVLANASNGSQGLRTISLKSRIYFIMSIPHVTLNFRVLMDISNLHERICDSFAIH